MLPLRRIVAAALAGCALSAAPAAADSISYVKDGDVYLTTPDGARTVQVTTTGGYASASQADDGRIVAAKGDRIHVLDRWGAVLADFAPVAARTAGTISFTGPLDPAVSPDGTRIAFGFYVQYKQGDPNCGLPGGCQTGHLYAGTGYTRTTGPADWDEPGFRPEYGWGDPSWLDASRTLISGPGSAFVTEAAIDTAGDGANAAEWFSEGAVGNLFDGEMNRQGSAVAFVGNTQADRLLVYRVAAPPAPGAPPQGCLDAPATEGPWSSPSWSPDGVRLAFAGGRGIYVATLPGIGTACPAAGAVGVVAFAPGATSPDWGPADVPAGTRPQAPGQAPATPAQTGGAPPASVGAAPAPAPAAAGLAVAPAALGKALRHGLRVTTPCTGARVRVKARAGGKLVAAGRAACRAGQATVRVRFTAAARRRLAGRARVVLAVRAGAGPAARVTLHR